MSSREEKILKVLNIIQEELRNEEKGTLNIYGVKLFLSDAIEYVESKCNKLHASEVLKK